MSLLDGFASIGYSIAEMLSLGTIKSPMRREAEKPVRMPKSYDERLRDHQRRYEAHWRRWRRDVFGEQEDRQDG